MESSRQDLLNDMAEHRPILKNHQNTYSTFSPKCIVQFWLCNKAAVNVFPHKADPCCAIRIGHYLLGR